MVASIFEMRILAVVIHFSIRLFTCARSLTSPIEEDMLLLQLCYLFLQLTSFWILHTFIMTFPLPLLATPLTGGARVPCTPLLPGWERRCTRTKALQVYTLGALYLVSGLASWFIGSGSLVWGCGSCLAL